MWELQGGVIVDLDERELVCKMPEETLHDPAWSRWIAYAKRIIACIHACDGLTTEEVAALGPGGVKKLMERTA